MKKLIYLLPVFIALSLNIYAQKNDSASLVAETEKESRFNSIRAFEVESLAPMFISGGYHFAFCYRYQGFRLRASIINGGKYDAETAGLNNSANNFKRYYKTSPGFFLGYNIWKGLELYTYLELHNFEIEQKATGNKKEIKSTDIGGGISYQYFFGKYFYIQPGIHIYLRKENSVNFGNAWYSIPKTDISPVIRIGLRFLEFSM